MTVSEYLQQIEAERGCSRAQARRLLAAMAMLSPPTVAALEAGQRPKTMRVADAIELATGGAVTARELCELPQDGAA